MASTLCCASARAAIAGAPWPVGVGGVFGAGGLALVDGALAVAGGVPVVVGAGVVEAPDAGAEPPWPLTASECCWSWLALSCDCLTAPCALSIARPRPATPGALGPPDEPEELGVAGWVTGAGVPEPPLVDFGRSATNHTAASRTTAISAICTGRDT